MHDTTLLESQTQASPLAFRGDVLVQSVGGELRAWDTITMQRTDTWTLPHRHFCFVQDGTLVAFGFPPNARSSAIHRIKNGKVTTSPGPILPSGGTHVVLPARSADEVYVSVREDIYLLQTSEIAAVLKHPRPYGHNRDQLISRGDGRLVGCGHETGFCVIEPRNGTVYPTPDRYVMHLAAATRDRIWYSYAVVTEDWNAHTLILAAVDKPMTAECTIDVAPGRIVHLASHGDTVAALVITVRDDKLWWSIVVIDETGRERWRAEVPDAFSTVSTVGMLIRGFIAIGDRRVVLAVSDGTLLAWDAATGKPVS
jgi:outer membrane protein assembly factor BamB